MIDDPGEAPLAREAPATARAGVRIPSAELFRGRREIVIVHRGPPNPNMRVGWLVKQCFNFFRKGGAAATKYYLRN